MLFLGDVSRDASPIIRLMMGEASLETSPKRNSMIQDMINSNNMNSTESTIPNIFKELLAQKLMLCSKIKKVLSSAHRCSLEQRARNVHDHNEQILPNLHCNHEKKYTTCIPDLREIHIKLESVPQSLRSNMIRTVHTRPHSQVFDSSCWLTISFWRSLKRLTEPSRFFLTVKKTSKENCFIIVYGQL